MEVNQKAVDAAVKKMLGWWTVNDKRDAFEAALRKVIARDLEEMGRCRLYVDYDPQGSLLEAVRDAGVECSGFMFSAQGIFRCQKSGVTVYRDRATSKDGYGAPNEELA